MIEIGGVRAVSPTSATREVGRNDAPAKVVKDPAVKNVEIAPDHHFSVSPSRSGAFSNVTNIIKNRVLEHAKKHSNPLLVEQQANHIISRIKKRHLRAVTDQQTLRRFLWRFTRGSRVDDLELLDAVVRLSEGDDLMRNLGYDQDLTQQFILDHEQALIAYLNIASVVDEFAELASSSELVRTYQDILVTSTSLLSALFATLKKIPYSQLSIWVPFLTKACVADLISPNIGADKTHLQFVLQELKSFRILNTLNSMLGKLKEERLPKVDPEQLLFTTMEFVRQPIATMPTIDKWIVACTHAEQILFFQDYRGVFSRLPPEAYQNLDESKGVIGTLQKRIDTLVYTE